ncbi:DUF2190 family protein [Candidatus Pacearchaeota archaeon]|nr:DUF2190 family protein [Candidatus Pacearchaeota archaeon]
MSFLTDVVGFYLNDGAIGDEMAVITKAEKVEVIKNAGEAWVPGDTLYWDDSASNVTVTLTSNTMIGYVQKAAESADVLGMIVFDGHLQFLKT